MFNDNIDGAIINSGSGPCANTGFSCSDEKNVTTYSTKGMLGKPMFFYSGVNDSVVLNDHVVITSEWFKNQGANIARQWVSDFLHIFPNSVRSNTKYNPPLSCGTRNESYSAVQNCGYNMALEALQHIYGPDLEIDNNYQDSGKLYAIDQKPFNIEGAYMAD